MLSHSPKWLHAIGCMLFHLQWSIVDALEDDFLRTCRLQFLWISLPRKFFKLSHQRLLVENVLHCCLARRKTGAGLSKRPAHFTKEQFRTDAKCTDDMVILGGWEIFFAQMVFAGPQERSGSLFLHAKWGRCAMGFDIGRAACFTCSS